MVSTIPLPFPEDNVTFPVCNHINLGQAINYTCNIYLILSSHLRIDIPNSLFPSFFFPLKPCRYVLYPMPATCPAHLSVLCFVTRILPAAIHDADFLQFPSNFPLLHTPHLPQHNVFEHPVPTFFS